MSTDIDNNVFGNTSDDGVIGLVPYGFNSSSDDSFELPQKSNKRKRRVQKERRSHWFGVKNKNLREHGKKYKGRRKVGATCQWNNVKNAKSLKQKCNCADKGNKGVMKCRQITDAAREEIFKQFWKMRRQQKQVYVKCLVQSLPIKRRRIRQANNVSKRTQSLIYHLKVNNQNFRVCRTLFINTLDISRNIIQSWLKKTQQNRSVDVTPQSEQLTDLISFFDSLPATESHYCRALTSKKYLLSEWRSKSMLYEFYTDNWCYEGEKSPLSITVFNETFKNKNLSLFIPKKDQCEICACYTVENLSSEVYLLHQEKK